MVRPRGVEPPCLSASGPQPDVSTRSTTAACPVRESHPHRLEVSEASCCWKNRTRKHEDVVPLPPRGGRGGGTFPCLMLDASYWMRDSELHGACVLMRHARRLRLPSRRMIGGPGRICTSTPGGHPLLRRACLLVPPRARMLVVPGGVAPPRIPKDQPLLRRPRLLIAPRNRDNVYRRPERLRDRPSRGGRELAARE